MSSTTRSEAAHDKEPKLKDQLGLTLRSFRVKPYRPIEATARPDAGCYPNSDWKCCVAAKLRNVPLATDAPRAQAQCASVKGERPDSWHKQAKGKAPWEAFPGDLVWLFSRCVIGV